LKKFILSIAGFLARIMPNGLKRAVYRSPGLSRWLRRVLNRAAPQGRSVVHVQAGALKGARLELDLHSEKDYWLGTYELDLQDAVHRLIEPGSVVYDVGANIGYVSLLISRQVGAEGKIVAIEALPTNVERLKRNVALNPFASNVQVSQAAVVDKQRKVKFLVHASTSMGKADGSAGRNELYKDELEVNGISLDNFIFEQKNPRPAAVKMDIEGGEVLAVRGMQRMLAEIKPLLLIELHGQEAAAVVFEALKKHDYHLFPMRAHSKEIHSLHELDWKAYVVGMPD
jgi:FkbM family methyltransferase